MTSILLAKTTINASKLPLQALASQNYHSCIQSTFFSNNGSKCGLELIYSINQRHSFSTLPYSSDATVSMPGYTRPATADMRSQQPLRTMTNEEKLNWSKQNKEFRYDYLLYVCCLSLLQSIYPCANDYFVFAFILICYNCF